MVNLSSARKVLTGGLDALKVCGSKRINTKFCQFDKYLQKNIFRRDGSLAASVNYRSYNGKLLPDLAVKHNKKGFATTVGYKRTLDGELIGKNTSSPLMEQFLKSGSESMQAEGPNGIKILFKRQNAYNVEKTVIRPDGVKINSVLYFPEGKAIPRMADMHNKNGHIVTNYVRDNNHKLVEKSVMAIPGQYLTGPIFQANKQLGGITTYSEGFKTSCSPDFSPEYCKYMFQKDYKKIVG